MTGAPSASSSTFADLMALRAAVEALEGLPGLSVEVRVGIDLIRTTERLTRREMRWVSWRRRRSGKGEGGTPLRGSFPATSDDAGIAHPGLSPSPGKKIHLTLNSR